MLSYTVDTAVEVGGAGARPPPYKKYGAASLLIKRVDSASPLFWSVTTLNF